MKARNDLGDTARIIEEEVEILLLRHFIPGQCNPQSADNLVDEVGAHNDHQFNQVAERGLA